MFLNKNMMLSRYDETYFKLMLKSSCWLYSGRNKKNRVSTTLFDHFHCPSAQAGKIVTGTGIEIVMR